MFCFDSPFFLPRCFSRCIYTLLLVSLVLFPLPPSSSSSFFCPRSRWFGAPFVPFLVPFDRVHSFVEASFQGDFPLRGLGLGEEIRASTAAKQTHTLQEEVREGERRQREETETYIHTYCPCVCAENTQRSRQQHVYIMAASKYDRAITVFSPDGHLFQVEYALEAVRKGNTAVGVRGRDAVCLVVEKKTTAKLQDPRTIQKLHRVDDHVCLTFAGLTADARVLVNRARIEAQSYRLTLDEPASVEYMTRYIAGIQQRYTQSGGVRPYGISVLLMGFDEGSDEPQLFQTDPSGTFSRWRANATGRNSKTVREFLEKQDAAVFGEMSAEETVRLGVRAVLEVVEAGSDNVEVALMTKDARAVRFLGTDEVAEIVKEIEKERAEEEEKKKRTRPRAT